MLLDVLKLSDIFEILLLRQNIDPDKHPIISTRNGAPLRPISRKQVWPPPSVGYPFPLLGRMRQPKRCSHYHPPWRSRERDPGRQRVNRPLQTLLSYDLGVIVIPPIIPRIDHP